jgi:hypothetical protein
MNGNDTDGSKSHECRLRRLSKLTNTLRCVAGRVTVIAFRAAVHLLPTIGMSRIKARAGASGRSLDG